MDHENYVNWFRHSSPYINAHRNKTFVLLLPGEGIAGDNFANIVHDIALLNSLGVRLVIVHGIRPQLEALLAERKQESYCHQGVRVTDADALDCATAVTGNVRSKIEAWFSMGLPNSPMHLSSIRVCSGNFIVARPLGIHDGVDYQFTGEVRRVDVDAINQQLALGATVLLSPLGYSPTGEVFNLLAEEVATEVAAAIGADKLILFSDQDGILDDRGQLIRELSLSQASYQYEQHGKIISDHLLASAINASQAGVERCHIISHQQDGALIEELFTRDGCGSLVFQDSYESIRTAAIDDVGGILELIQPLEEQGILVRRSRELLEREIEQFTVIERDGAIIACAALYPFVKERCAELACVVTHADYRGHSRGEKLLASLEKQARSQGLDTLFVLTTQTSHWFMEQGFMEGELDNLPARRQSMYNFQRNSRVLFKSL